MDTETCPVLNSVGACIAVMLGAAMLHEFISLNRGEIIRPGVMVRN
jgi:hypothetical protein